MSQIGEKNEVPSEKEIDILPCEKTHRLNFRCGNLKLAIFLSKQMIPRNYLEIFYGSDFETISGFSAI